MASYKEKAQAYINDNKFFMISKSWCPDANYAKSIFAKYGVSDKVEVLELDKIDEKEGVPLEKGFTEISGKKWVPTIWFNGEKFGTEQDLKKYESLEETEQVFKKAGLLS